MNFSLVFTLFAVGTFLPTCSAAESPLGVKLAIPSNMDGVHYLQQAVHPPSRFYVIVSNVSNEPQRVWDEHCSWGYFALSFEFTDITGKTTTAKKRDITWTVNSPVWRSLAPQESLVLEVHYAATNWWSRFPEPQGSRTVTMRAVFTVSPDEESRRHKVWTGRISSEDREVTIHPWKPETK
jgi:hypothetical protein